MVAHAGELSVYWLLVIEEECRSQSPVGAYTAAVSHTVVSQSTQCYGCSSQSLLVICRHSGTERWACRYSGS